MYICYVSFMEVTISRWGNSLGLRVPQDLARQASLKEGSAVDLRMEKGRIVIIPSRKRYKLSDLLVGMTPQAMHEAYDWGDDLGREIVED
jgi:antitoxin MazE